VFPLDSCEDVSVDPGHGYPDVMQQLSGDNGPWQAPYDDLTNNGFAWNYAARAGADRAGEVMGCYTDADEHVPALWHLAREFAVCSRWFCSVPSETWPNRLFAHAATSDNESRQDVRPYKNETIFNRLSDAGKCWRVYVGDIAQVMAYTNLLWSPGHDRFDFMEDFFDDARAGTLPNYSFIEPRHLLRWANSQHPRQRVQRGDRLLKEVYEALAGNPEVWRSVLLIVTYDEHGGFFDRISPPRATPPSPGALDPASGFAFDLLGPRVPALVVSPFVKRGRVDRTVYDHSSIVRTVREVFELGGPLTDRDRDAQSVIDLLTLSEPREPPPMPPLPELPDQAPEDPSVWAEGFEPDGTIALNDFQRSLVELKAVLDAEKPGVEPEELAAAPKPPFRSEAELEAFVADFQERHVQPS
jgi:phospholipase C